MSDEEANEEVDRELVELRELKSKLLRRAFDLKKELEQWENKKGEQICSLKKEDFFSAESQLRDLIDDHVTVDNRPTKKCVYLSSFMSGIKFDNVDRKWISENKYLYTANAKTKVLQFFVEITAEREDAAKNFNVLSIVCRFVNVRKCYFLEITPWVKRFTDDNDTTNLFNSVSNYTDQNVIRTKILAKCTKSNVAYAEECTEDEGGIIVFLHAKDKPSFIYFEIRWVLRFIESIWNIDNFFVIQPVSAEDDFLKENNQFLQEFRNRGIAKDKLEHLWDELCAAIERDSVSEPPAGRKGG